MKSSFSILFICLNLIEIIMHFLFCLFSFINGQFLLVKNKLKLLNLFLAIRIFFRFHYPSPTRSICEDTLVDVCVSYPEHMYT